MYASIYLVIYFKENKMYWVAFLLFLLYISITHLYIGMETGDGGNGEGAAATGIGID